MIHLKHLKFIFLFSLIITTSSSFAAMYLCNSDDVFIGEFTYDELDRSEKNDHLELDFFDFIYLGTRYTKKGPWFLDWGVQAESYHFDSNDTYVADLFSEVIRGKDGIQFNIKAKRINKGIFSGQLTVIQDSKESKFDCSCERQN